MRLGYVCVFILGSSLACGSGDAPDVAAPPMVTTPPAATTPAATTPAATNRCPEGLVFTGTWQGEYPGPPVDVKSPVTVPARAEACDGAATLQCTVPTGLYHPWSQDPAEFGTIRPVETYRAKRAVTVQVDDAPQNLAANDTVVVTTYWGEGNCSLKVGAKTGPGECPNLLEDEQGAFFDLVPGRDDADIQLFAVTCAEGTKAWIDADKALFDRPEVAEGGTPEYGKAEHAP